MNGRVVPSSSATRPISAGALRLRHVHLGGGRDNGEIAQHGAAHQPDAGQDRHVGQPLWPRRHPPAPKSEREADDDRDGRTVDPAVGQPG